jgi:signal recognition particle subunit SRP54
MGLMKNAHGRGAQMQQMQKMANVVPPQLVKQMGGVGGLSNIMKQMGDIPGLGGFNPFGKK